MKMVNRLNIMRLPVAIALVAFFLAISRASAATVNAVWNSATDVPITANGYTATGNTVNFTLNCAPVTGSDLMVVSNTALGFISGTFDNLTNGQPVALSYGGFAYNFVANYFGGRGNDLVLAWAGNRALAWGLNSDGQLGDTTTTQRLVPVPVTTTGVLAGKTLLAVAAGDGHSMALCSDGTVAAWGNNYDGELGDNRASGYDSLGPVLVNRVSGISALSGRSVVALAAGAKHSLALCSDGTLAAWGYNGDGELGDNTRTERFVPVPVNTAPGVSTLYGNAVVAIAAGENHSLALCSDGTVAGWGYNGYSQLGDNTSTGRLVPVGVNTNAGVSALYGKTVVAVAAGQYHSLALCTDGTVVAWGYNAYGQLGDNTTTTRRAPVAVSTASSVSALNGKQVVAIAAGRWHSLALCSDGTVAGWGYNTGGELGDNTTTQRLVPVAVNSASSASALCAKTVVTITAGQSHSLALCSDGTAAAWGGDSYGQLGNNDNTGTQCNVPVTVSTTPLAAGERWVRAASGQGASHSLALAAASSVPEMTVIGNGTAIPNGDATPSLSDGTDFGSAFVGSSTVAQTFTIENTGPSPLNLTGTPMVAVTGPQASDFTVALQPTSPVTSLTGTTTFQVTFAPNGIGTRIAILSITNDYALESPYTFTLQGTGTGALNASYTTGSEVPLTTCGFAATGSSVNFTLNFAPSAGTDLMVVSNTSLGFINGTFDNLTNGQMVALDYNGTTYTFVANYYGGSGNDLVLIWAYQRSFAWGENNDGQLGDSTSGTNRLLPVPVTATGVLAGKTVLALAQGSYDSLALCSDGTLAAWGLNSNGRLGDDTTTNRLVPVAVNTASGVSGLYGRMVVAVAAGPHTLALCSDGSVAAWGYNFFGQVGDNTTTDRLVPVTVNTSPGVSALYGKTVVAVAIGNAHSLALCSDGTVAAWGWNGYGQVGDNTTTSRNVPVAVNTAWGFSALYGKSVVGIAAGFNTSLALCSDGTVAAWGWNSNGQIGDNTSGTNRLAPVAVNTASGISALYDKTVVAIAAGWQHCLAQCSDGTVAAWGYNFHGELGDNTATSRSVPVAVNTDSGVSALYGKTVVSIAAGDADSLALCSDGTVAAWGYNGYGGRQHHQQPASAGDGECQPTGREPALHPCLQWL